MHTRNHHQGSNWPQGIALARWSRCWQELHQALRRCNSQQGKLFQQGTKHQMDTKWLQSCQPSSSVQTCTAWPRQCLRDRRNLQGTRYQQRCPMGNNYLQYIAEDKRWLLDRSMMKDTVRVTSCGMGNSIRQDRLRAMNWQKDSSSLLDTKSHMS